MESNHEWLAVLQTSTTTIVSEWNVHPGDVVSVEDLARLHEVLQVRFNAFSSMVADAVLERDALQVALAQVERERDEARNSAFLTISDYKQRLRRSAA